MVNFKSILFGSRNTAQESKVPERARAADQNKTTKQKTTKERFTLNGATAKLKNGQLFITRSWQIGFGRTETRINKLPDFKYSLSIDGETLIVEGPVKTKRNENKGVYLRAVENHWNAISKAIDPKHGPLYDLHARQQPDILYAAGRADQDARNI